MPDLFHTLSTEVESTPDHAAGGVESTPPVGLNQPRSGVESTPPRPLSTHANTPLYSFSYKQQAAAVDTLVLTQGRSFATALSFLDGGDGMYKPIVRSLLCEYTPRDFAALLRAQWGEASEATLEWFRARFVLLGGDGEAFARIVAVVAITRDRARAQGGRPSIRLAHGVMRRLPHLRAPPSTVEAG